MSSRIAITVSTISADGDYTPQENLLQSQFKFIDEADNVTEIPFSGFSDLGSGNYVFYGFSISNTVPFKKAHLKINGNFQYGYGLFIIYSDNNEPASQDFNDGRFGKLGSSNTWSGATNQFEAGLFHDTLYLEDVCTGQDFEMESLSNLYLGITQPANTTLLWKEYADEHYLDSTTGANYFVTLNTAQNITGKKSFYGGVEVDTGTGITTNNTAFRIKTASNPPNGGITALEVGYQGNNRPKIDFKSSDINSDGTGTVNRWRIKTSSSQYISGNLALNDYAHAKWVADNFQSKYGGSYQSKTVLVDSECPEAQALKVYSNINEAINSIVESGEDLDTTNRWTIVVRQHTNATGYTEDIELPDYINLIGEGVVKIQGQLSRPATSEVLSSKIQNLQITTGIAQSHNLERLESFNCIFTSGDSIDIESAKLSNCELYAFTSITSGDNNKIKNCVGNKSVSWQTNDVVFGFDTVIGASY